MIGRLIAKIRTDKGLSKTDLSRATNINVGHLTHIEKEERNPSHKALKSICDALDIPIQPLMYAYDRNLTEEQIDYSVVDHIKYDSIPVVNPVERFVTCPQEASKASFIMKAYDDSMFPKIDESDYVYVELNAPLSNKDIGLFQYNDTLIIRKFIIRKNDLVLRADDSNIDDIIVKKDSDFYILGKIIGKNNSEMSKFVSF